MFEPVPTQRRGAARALRAYEARWTSPFRRTRRNSWPRCCARWRGPGRAPRRGCCARPRARRPMPGWAWWCRPWRWAWAGENSGSGVIQFVDRVTGQPQITGRYLALRKARARGAEARGEGDLSDARSARPVAGGARARGLCRASAPWRHLPRAACARRCRSSSRSRTAALPVLDALKVPRSSRAAVRIAVALAEDGIITREEALLRVEPRALSELCTAQVDPRAPRDVSRAASRPARARRGADRVHLRAAQASAARGEPCILVRRETTPEDIRGMHAAGRADRTRRHDQPRRGDRARAGPALRRGRATGLRIDAQEPAR
jgi:hypothetical protein